MAKSALVEIEGPLVVLLDKYKAVQSEGFYLDYWVQNAVWYPSVKI